MPSWTKGAIDSWTVAAQISDGLIFRSTNKGGRISKSGMSPRGIFQMVKHFGGEIGVPNLAPHDLRRYAESRTMPNRSEGCSFGVELVTNAVH
jgi:integrase